jgi:hypothetical protein
MRVRPAHTVPTAPLITSYPLHHSSLLHHSSHDRLVNESNDGDKVMAENRAKREREFSLRKLEHELKTADKVEMII